MSLTKLKIEVRKKLTKPKVLSIDVYNFFVYLNTVLKKVFTNHTYQLMKVSKSVKMKNLE